MYNDDDEYLKGLTGWNQKKSESKTNNAKPTKKNQTIVWLLLENYFIMIIIMFYYYLIWRISCQSNSFSFIHNVNEWIAKTTLKNTHTHINFYFCLICMWSNKTRVPVITMFKCETKRIKKGWNETKWNREPNLFNYYNVEFELAFFSFFPIHSLSQFSFPYSIRFTFFLDLIRSDSMIFFLSFLTVSK